MKNIVYHTLPNGLRIVHLQVPGSTAEHFGIAIRAGSSQEVGSDEAGLAHFVEHTLFKGTVRRSSWHIINRMEAVGGELNAFTTKEDTVIYTAFPRGSLIRALDLVTDIILNSRFPHAEIDREREVICDEINSYLDSPADAVYDEFEDMLYAGTPWGHNILGTLESVRGITGEMCRRWITDNYHASGIVAFYAGPLSPDSFIAKATPFLGIVPSSPGRTADSVRQWKDVPHFQVTRSAETHQAHTIVGTALERPDLKGRSVLALLTNLLGGPGMNSLLNVTLRERRGLVYNVDSSVANYGNSMMFATCYGCDPQDNEKCLKLVADEVQAVAEGKLSARRIAAAKKQYIGQLTLSLENPESRVMGVARRLLLHGDSLTVQQTAALLAEVSPADIAAMAARLLPLSRLTLSPLG